MLSVKPGVEVEGGGWAMGASIAGPRAGRVSVRVRRGAGGVVVVVEVGIVDGFEVGGSDGMVAVDVVSAAAAGATLVGSVAAPATVSDSAISFTLWMSFALLIHTSSKRVETGSSFRASKLPFRSSRWEWS